MSGARELILAPLRQLASLNETKHRPWPRPPSPWLMGQSWLDLLFLHWPIDARQLRHLVPPPLDLDLWEGAAWVGVSPFEVVGLRAVATPPLPLLSSFPELNVRTYVTFAGKPGIWFFSLDAASRLAVAAARRIYKLPYFHARMRVQRQQQMIIFRSQRQDSRAQPSSFAARYQPQGKPNQPLAGSLEHFLTERYCLYALSQGGELLRAEIHHPPWRLRNATVDLAQATITPANLKLSPVPPLAHFAARQDVLVWPPQRV